MLPVEWEDSNFLATVWRETLEGANFGEIARKTSLEE